MEQDEAVDLDLLLQTLDQMDNLGPSTTKSNPSIPTKLCVQLHCESRPDELNKEQLDNLLHEISITGQFDKLTIVHPSREQPPPSPTASAIDLHGSFDFDSPVHLSSRPPTALPNDENINTSNESPRQSFPTATPVRDVANGHSLVHQFPCYRPSAPPSAHSSASLSSKQRCIRASISGPTAPRGHKATSFSKAVCDSLICVDCSFTVSTFPQARWRPECDYIFIRTNRNATLDTEFANEKLSEMLESCSSSCAYACQCSFVSVEVEMTVGGFGATHNWSCRGHDTG